MEWDSSDCGAVRMEAPVPFSCEADPDSKLAFAPTACLAAVWFCMLFMLYMVGYLQPDDKDEVAKAIAALPTTGFDVAARRGALAYSGVLLALTMALFLASASWAISACRRTVASHKVQVNFWAGLFFVVSGGVSWVIATLQAPFTSQIGQKLLDPTVSGIAAPMAVAVPVMMFLLSCLVPAVLLAGASYLLQPEPKPTDALTANWQLRHLKDRVRELDQMLYIGALALVFGTLQLSAGLSVPLASLPKAANLKVEADLCKAIGVSSAAGVFFAQTASSQPGNDAFDKACLRLPADLGRLGGAESLRQLAHDITLCFGLAFSGLLACVYVPALIVLRLMIEPRQRALAAVATSTLTGPTVDVGDIDPLRRAAAVAATLSPFLAGLLANALAAS